MAEGEERPQEIPEEQHAQEPPQGLSRRDLLKRGLRYGTALGVGGAVGTSWRWMPPLVRNIQERFKDYMELPPLPEFKSPGRDQKVVVIPVVGSNVAKPESTKGLEALLENVRWGFNQDSYGKAQFDFTVLPWQQVAEQLKGDDKNKLADIGNKILNQSDYDPDEFTTRLYVSHADLFAGGFGGRWQPNSYNKAWLYTGKDGINFDDAYGFMASVAKHELGHTLGMPHSNSIDTKGVKKEYGGESDTMGQAASIGIEFNTPQRVSMGWIGRDQIKDVTNDGIYTLNPTSITPPGLEHITRALRIQKPDTNERYYVSLRANNIASFGGLEIHQWNERQDISPNQVLIPETQREFGWKVGDEWYDAKNGIRIKLISRQSFFTQTPDAGEFKLQVTFDKK